MQQFQKNFIKPFIYYSTVAALPFSVLGAMQVNAASLDEVVQEQLAIVNGLGPCYNFIDISGASPTGALAEICARPVPANPVVASSNGGGSAVSAVNPSTGLPLPHDEKIESKSLGNWDIFATLENESLDRSLTETEGAFESSINRYLFGTSFLPSTNASYSFVLNISEHDGDYANGGNFTYESLGFAFIGRNTLGDNFNLSYAAQFDNVSSSRERIVNFVDIDTEGDAFNPTEGAPVDDNDYSQIGLSLNGIYDLNFNAFTLSPQFGLEWQKRDIGTSTETGDSGLELTFYDEEITSFQALAGVQGSYAISTSFGAFIPQFSAILRHEFEADQRDVEFSFVGDENNVRFTFQTDELDSDYFELSAGGVFVLQNGLQFFANARTFAAHDYYDSFAASVGFRMEL